MKLLLVRHGMTDANKKRQFCGGQSDVHVCLEGRKILEARVYPKVARVYASPMIRCLETAEIVFGCKNPEIVEAFRECDFGDMEMKTNEECAGNTLYDEFVRSGGSKPFPGGESLADFDIRVQRGFDQLIEELICHPVGEDPIGIAVHGGTIMSIMNSLIPTDGGFYDYNVKNGEGYLITIDEKSWREGEKHADILSGIDTRIYH